MKIYNKPALWVLFGAVTALSIFAINQVSAKDENGMQGLGADKSPVVLTITASGNVLLRGEITAISNGTVSVKSWGSPWAIHTSATTNIISATKSLADFKVGDFVGVQGTMNDTDFSVEASTIRLWGQKIDHDHDGLPDNQDSDDDNDHIDDSHDSFKFDHNNNGVDDEHDQKDNGQDHAGGDGIED